MTRSQSRMVSLIKNEVNNHLYSDKYEVKEFEVKEYEGFVSLVAETGMKDDEGTMASVFCRDRMHVFIGKRGGITYPVSKNGKHTYRRYKTFLATCIDQR